MLSRQFEARVFMEIDDFSSECWLAVLAVDVVHLFSANWIGWKSFLKENLNKFFKDFFE
jgi:hypothetical protein